MMMMMVVRWGRIVVNFVTGKVVSSDQGGERYGQNKANTPHNNTHKLGGYYFLIKNIQKWRL